MESLAKIQRTEWVNAPIGEHLHITASISEGCILHLIMVGIREAENQAEYESFRSQILDEFFPNGAPYVEIVELDQLKGIPSFEVRRLQTQYRLSEQFGNCKASFIVRPSLLLGSMYRIAYLLQRKSVRYSVEIFPSFDAALLKAKEIASSLIDSNLIHLDDFQFSPDWIIHTKDEKGQIHIGVSRKKIIYLRYVGYFTDPSSVDRTIELMEVFFQKGLLEGQQYYRIVDLSELKQLSFFVRLQYAKEVKAIHLRKNLTCIGTFAIQASYWLKMALKVSRMVVDLRLEYVNSIEEALHQLNHRLSPQQKPSTNDFQSEFATHQNRKVTLLQEDLDSLLHMFGTLAWTQNSAPLIDFPEGHPLHDTCNTYKLFQDDYRSILLRYKTEERKARQLAIKANTANKAKSEFLANMSHEIRTPMNGMTGLISLLSQSGLNSEQKHYVELLNTSTQSLLKLVNDVLDFSKVDAGKLDIESIPFHLPSLLEEIKETSIPTTRQKELDISLVIQKEFPEYWKGDPTRLRQVITNLVTNSIKFTEKGGIQIFVDAPLTEFGDSQVRIQIVDTGIGIPSDKLDSIFDTFQQADSSTTRRYGGTGLGLAICKKIVETMGGKMGVYSKLGMGSTFWFQIPLEPSSIEFANQRKLNDWDPLFIRTGVKVLLVEDNAINQKVAKGILSKLGIDCDIAHHGVHALEILEQMSYDLVFMDCMMPEMDGYEATRQIRHHKYRTPLGVDLPIVAMTANAMSEDRTKALACGMNDYLSKPISIPRLRQVLETYLA